MEKALIELNKDIKRCEDILNQNNHLELVIAIEELVDKYKNSIKGIYIDNDKVWNYTPKDLEDVKAKLKLYKNNLINKSNQEKISLISDEIKIDVKNNKNLPQSKKYEILCMIDELENISNKNIGIDEKWLYMKKYIIYSSEQDINLGTMFISIIDLILKHQ